MPGWVLGHGERGCRRAGGGGWEEGRREGWAMESGGARAGTSVGLGSPASGSGRSPSRSHGH